MKTITLEINQITITLQTQALAKRLDVAVLNDAPIALTLTKPITIWRRGQEMKMLIGGEPLKIPERDPALIALVAKAHLLRTELETGATTSIKEFAIKYNMDHGDAKNMLHVSYLAPSIVEGILEGHQPIDVTARRLKYMSNLPINWANQRQVLGFTKPHQKI